ncbi:hypothetical protein OH77DRAFT_1077032 [Trametes cingulata]|nr:hypothetical protein OH77DRAFT_1077032 [Trametes cingulata]
MGGIALQSVFGSRLCHYSLRVHRGSRDDNHLRLVLRRVVANRVQLVAWLVAGPLHARSYALLFARRTVLGLIGDSLDAHTPSASTALVRTPKATADGDHDAPVPRPRIPEHRLHVRHMLVHPPWTLSLDGPDLQRALPSLLVLRLLVFLSRSRSRLGVRWEDAAGTAEGRGSRRVPPWDAFRRCSGRALLRPTRLRLVFLRLVVLNCRPRQAQVRPRTYSQRRL